MTEDEAKRAALVAELDETERSRLFHVERRMKGMTVTIYDTSSDMIGQLGHDETKDYQTGIEFDIHDTMCSSGSARVLLVHMQVGEWGFWVDSYGVQRGASAWRHVVRLP